MITINYLSHGRPEYHALTFHFLKLIKPENKAKLKLNVLASVDNDWVPKCQQLGMNCAVYVIGGNNNYLHKLAIALNDDSKYIIKLDEDCFINNHIWDYIIENIETLDNDENLLIAPIITNNIPSCDVFIEKAITDETIKSEVYKHFLNRQMPNGLWGVNYEPLNAYTVEANEWNASAYYDGVRDLPTATLGIHPLRISFEAQEMINNYIGENTNIITDKNEYSLMEIDAPYFTNSIFAMRRDVWTTIINERGSDNFDEISLNTHRRNHNKKMLFINNGFGVHLMFNTVSGNGNPWGIGSAKAPEHEANFYKILENKIL